MSESHTSCASGAKNASSHFSADSLSKMAEAAAEFTLLAYPQSFGKASRLEEEFELTEEVLAPLPDWTQIILKPGARLEKHVLPDGTIVVKLLDDRQLVLAVRMT
jgi:hypothetical protein